MKFVLVVSPLYLSLVGAKSTSDMQIEPQPEKLTVTGEKIISVVSFPIAPVKFIIQ